MGQKSERPASPTHDGLLEMHTLQVTPIAVLLAPLQVAPIDVQPVLLAQPSVETIGLMQALHVVEPIGSIAFSTCRDQPVPIPWVVQESQESGKVSKAQATSEEPSDDDAVRLVLEKPGQEAVEPAVVEKAALVEATQAVAEEAASA